LELVSVIALKFHSDADFPQDTPKNITYHTPPRDSLEHCLLEAGGNIRPVLKQNDYIPSWFPYPGNGTSSGFKKNDRRNRLSTVLELSSESGLTEDGFSTSRTIQTYLSSETDYFTDHAVIRYVFLSAFVSALIFQELGCAQIFTFERSREF
jgi:hypothetical protein